MPEILQALIFILVAVLIIGLYFLPSLTAKMNHKKNAQSVMVINLFLGWTLLGWVIALAMAAGQDAEEFSCSNCGALISRGTRFCPSCGETISWQ